VFAGISSEEKISAAWVCQQKAIDTNSPQQQAHFSIDTFQTGILMWMGQALSGAHIDK
jgi:hypothetical protein